MYYCKLDVTILRLACLKFRSSFLDSGDICPFSEACTIASACNKLFRKRFLKKNTIGIIPRNGYRMADNQSLKAIKWLALQERREGIKIIHAGRGREIRLHTGNLVDGYYEDSVSGEKKVYQFYGCYYHCCAKCYPTGRTREFRPGESIDACYERTLSIAAKIRRGGYTLIEIWECEFDRQLKEDENDRKYLEENPFSTYVLNPRDALYGGRTEYLSTFYKISGDEKIKYVDICSLYPWVLKYKPLPIGHAKVHVGEECKLLTGIAIMRMRKSGTLKEPGSRMRFATL